MEVAQQLLDILPEYFFDSSLSDLKAWSEKVETLLSSSPEKQIAEASSDNALLEILPPILPQVTSRLHSHLLASISDETFSVKIECSSEDDETALNLTTEAVASWRELCDDNKRESKLETLSVLLRASKNWLRWYLQIYSAVAAPTAVTTPMRRLQSRPMLELYMLILEQYCDAQEEELARYAAQLLFYATYNPVPSSDEGLKETFEFLTNDLTFFTSCLTFLLRTNNASVALWLVRNVQNLLVSFPKASALVEETKSELTEEFATCPWVPAESPATYKTVFRAIIIWALKAENTFPGDKDDVRAELIVEILRCSYALRVGTDLAVPSKDDRFCQVVIDLLHLDPNDERCRECQIATVSLFMDSNPSFGAYLVEHNAVDPLLDVLERQVTKVLDNNQVDNSAAAALTPILIVLHMFCKGNTDFRRMTKDRIFPLEAEPNFWRLAEEERQRHGGTAKNISPLDAPKDTLRWKLIRLLTWLQGHIKRFAGELLWVLCDGGSQEFIFRVGIANALPILGLKGIVQLPSQLQS